MNRLERNIVSATKWSTIATVTSKLIIPLTNIVLARILAPEIFGIVAMVTMVISFAELFADAGFQRYIIQNNFENDNDLLKSTTVAFWTNLLVSILIWVGIVLFNNQISVLVGSPGYGKAIIWSGLSLPITSFSSIQMALYKRKFDFKTLFLVRLAGSVVPFFVTIPLALLGFTYWSLIIGTIAGNLLNALILTYRSEWKPYIFFDFKLLKKMLRYSIWSILESLVIWLTTWIDTFIIGSILNSAYYLGLYKTSVTTVNGIMGIITSAIMPVLFSALSRLQENDLEYKKTLFTFQKLVSMLLLPMGVGIYVYRDVVTNVLLGSKWSEASLLIGLWGLTNSIQITISHFSSEVYRSKGKPSISVVAQLLHVAAIIPTCIISAKQGFTTLVYARSIISIQFVPVHLFLINKFFKITPFEMTKNLIIPFFSSVIMGVITMLLNIAFEGQWWFSIPLTIVIYVLIINIFPSTRESFFSIYKLITRRR